jgi:hypothetical protein
VDELTPEQKFAAEEAGIIVARGLLAGRSRERLLDDLYALDWSPGAADRFIGRVERDLERFTSSAENRRRMRQEARRELLAGGLLLVAGLVLGGLLYLVFLARLVLLGWVLSPLPGAYLLYRGWTRRQLYGYLERALRERDGQGGPLSS